MTPKALQSALRACLPAAAAGLTGLAHASDPRGAFAACIASKSSATDDMVPARRLFLAMAGHPAMRGRVLVDGQQGVEVDERMAVLFQRRMTSGCATPLRARTMADPRPAFEAAYARLGERAGHALIAAREVAAATGRMVRPVDMDAIEAAVLQGAK